MLILRTKNYSSESKRLIIMNVFITQFCINNNVIVLQHNNSLYLLCITIFHACEKMYRYNKLYSSYK